MDIFEAMSKRCSYRGEYKDEGVSREDLRRIIEAGLLAPSGKNCQTTDFVIVDDAELVSKIASMHPANKAMQQAKAFIACVISKEPAPVFEGLSFEVEDCAAAVENMLLAIAALGYGSVWIDGWLRREDRNEKIGKMLNVPNDKIVRILLPVGVPAKQTKQPAKKSFEERAWFNSYRG